MDEFIKEQSNDSITVTSIEPSEVPILQWRCRV